MLQAYNNQTTPVDTSSMSGPYYIHPALQTTQSPFHPVHSSQEANGDGPCVAPWIAHGVYGIRKPNVWQNRRVRTSKL